MSDLSDEVVREWAATEPWESKPGDGSILNGYGALFNQTIALSREVMALRERVALLTRQRDEAVAGWRDLTDYCWGVDEADIVSLREKAARSTQAIARLATLTNEETTDA